MGAQRVLVVDDDPDIRDLLVSVLSDDGYEAESARNGLDALDVLDRWKADVIVLDLMMPVMDGWTFAARMKEKWSIPIVVLSAATDVAKHGEALGAADVVPKPFDLERLLPCIARVANGDAA
ncbi:MAG TPA: response regulator transcription factor [Candidatus Limnocylindrales bacterium]|nr:response regulator transcription factor [Candidatus Limnocylindrales bacterium]